MTPEEVQAALLRGPESITDPATRVQLARLLDHAEHTNDLKLWRLLEPLAVAADLPTKRPWYAGSYKLQLRDVLGLKKGEVLPHY